MKELKKHSKQYRKIKGVYFECHTADSSTFFTAINESKLKNLKYRIIKNQFYLQVNNQGDQYMNEIKIYLLNKVANKGEIQ